MRELSLMEHREAQVLRLGAMVLARYRAVRVASDLLLAGFVPLLFAAAVMGVAAVIV